MKNRIPTFDDFLFERTPDKIPHPKHKWFEVNPKDYDDLEDDFYKLIQTAYKDVPGGHLKVQKPDDVFDAGWTYWVAMDNDNNPDFNVVKGYKVTPYGYKSAVAGHDVTKVSKTDYLTKFAEDMSKPGKYAEVSEKLAEILINKYHVHIVSNPDAIKAVLGKSDVVFYGKNPENPSMPGDGWYTRKIAGGVHAKILVGKPIVQESVTEGLDNGKPTVLVLHGYESSVYPPRLKVLSADYNLLTPEMDYDHNQGLFEKTYQTYKNANIDLIVGSSMGGYFGYYLASLLDVPALLFNPAVIETTSGIKKQEVRKGKYNPAIYVVSGKDDDIVISWKLKQWFKENARNYEFITENMGHRPSDETYIKYVKKYV
ncbi:MAG: YqiA/YcfP family alpha/beta fold hydrolase [Candidatus Pacearchaeota archaeon]|jgi:hypothetical protein|nr:hypothetical protein [Clostridia bacterium]